MGGPISKPQDKMAAKKQAASTSLHGPVTPKPGHGPCPRPELRRPLPTAPPRGLRPEQTALVHPASQSRPSAFPQVLGFRMRRGRGKSPARGKPNYPHTKFRCPQFAATSCNEKYTWKIQATAPHPKPQTPDRPREIRTHPKQEQTRSRSRIRGGPSPSGARNVLRLLAHAGPKPRLRKQDRLLWDPKSQALTGTKDQAGVGLSGGPKRSRVAWNLEGFLGWRLACSLGFTNPNAHPLSPSRIDPRATAQGALTQCPGVQFLRTPRCLASEPSGQGR